MDGLGQALADLRRPDRGEGADLAQIDERVDSFLAGPAAVALRPGDLIMTGTPAGVGPVQPGSVLRGTIEGLDPVDLTIGPAE